jgi:hypothetical protein
MGLVIGVFLSAPGHAAVYVNVAPLSEPMSDFADMSRMVVTVDGSAVIGARVELTFAPEQGEIEKTVSVSADQVPDPYRPVPFNARIPFYREDQTLDLHVLMIDVGSLEERDALELLQKYSADLTTRERFEHYARARILATRVLNETDPLMNERNQARAVFSFLRLASDLAETRNLQLDQLVESGVVWLREALQARPGTVRNATLRPQDEIEDLIRRLRAAEARRFEQLYTKIVDLGKDSLPYCPLMKSAQVAVAAIPDDENRFPGLGQVKAKIGTAFGPCMYAALLRARDDSEAVRLAVAAQGEAQADILLRTADQATASRTVKDIARQQENAIRDISRSLRRGIGL